MAKLSNDTITTIETQIGDILREAYGSLSNVTLPVDPSKIAELYGIQIYTSQFTDSSISGMYDKSAKAIHIARDEYLPRQLFTMAHELGHFFLHKTKQNEIFYRQDSLGLGTKLKIETEADWFASTLLMPTELLRSYWEITQEITKLAALFGVSESAMRWRLHNLELKRYAIDKVT